MKNRNLQRTCEPRCKLRLAANLELSVDPFTPPAPDTFERKGQGPPRLHRPFKIGCKTQLAAKNQRKRKLEKEAGRGEARQREGQRVPRLLALKEDAFIFFTGAIQA